MLKLFLTTAVVAIVVATATIDTKWTIFKARHNKKYSSEEEDRTRKHIWVENKKYIEEHNKLYSQGKSTFYLGENEFADMTNREFVSNMIGLKADVSLTDAVRKPDEYNPDGQKSNFPASLDWRKKGYVTAVKNQGQTKNSWAFAATGAMEGQQFMSSGKLVSLSESNLIDCSDAPNATGRSGVYAQITNAFQYVITNKGIDTEATYPYNPKVGPCQFNASNVGASFYRYFSGFADQELVLQIEVVKHGPVSSGMDGSHPSFQHYKGGIYSEKMCNSSDLNHSVLTVGYGADSSHEYWLVKNSWGTSWGMDGYLKVARNESSMCGIGSFGSGVLV